MKYADVIIEAAEYNVLVEEGMYGTIRFYDGSFNIDATAWMSHSTGKTWIAHNDKGTSFRGSKVAVANWCLDQAANGST